MLRWLASGALRAVGSVESALLRSRPLRHPPMFVIGPPRSGTTLLGQVITHALDVAYLPNSAVQLCTGLDRPPIVTATRLVRRFGRPVDAPGFTSHGGRGVGAHGSGDSDFIWRFVVPDGYLDEHALDDDVARRVRKIVGGVERLFGRPFVDKSVGHSLRVRAFADLFPGAMFVRTRRNPLAVAQSVYLARRESLTADRGGVASAPGPRDWPTPFARGWQELSREDLYTQAARQQALFDRDIDDGVRDLPPGRVLEVRYDLLCRSPGQEIRRVRDFMARNGAPVAEHGEVPGAFRLSSQRRLERTEYERLVELVDRVYSGRFEPLDEPEGGNV